MICQTSIVPICITVDDVVVYSTDLDEPCTPGLNVTKIKCPRKLLTVVFYICCELFFIKYGSEMLD